MEICKGYGGPTKDTRGEKGDLYVDLLENNIYECLGVSNPGVDLGYVTVYKLEDNQYLWGTARGGAIMKYETGTYTPETDQQSVQTLEHGLGMTPTFVLVYTKEAEAFGNRSDYMCTYASFSFNPGHSTQESHWFVHTSGNTTVSAGSDNQSGCGTETTFKICAFSDYKLKAGVTYTWVVGVVAD